jgi:enoyl-CoA hydratase/carnithine racemase
MAYEDIIVEVRGQIGIIKLNRPKALNSFGGKHIAWHAGTLVDVQQAISYQRRSPRFEI